MVGVVGVGVAWSGVYCWEQETPLLRLCSPLSVDTDMVKKKDNVTGTSTLANCVYGPRNRPLPFVPSRLVAIRDAVLPGSKATLLLLYLQFPFSFVDTQRQRRTLNPSYARHRLYGLRTWIILDRHGTAFLLSIGSFFCLDSKMFFSASACLMSLPPPPPTNSLQTRT